jgi:hypothetical protein
MYTHYFEKKDKPNKDIFKAFVADVKKLFKAAAKKKIFLADGAGTVGTRPIANELEVCFNGMDFSSVGGEDGSYESLCIPCNRSVSRFCKTSRNEYDLVVAATLIALKKHFPDSVISSDGDNKEQEWIDAKDFCQSTLGYGKTFDVDKGDFKPSKKKRPKKTYEIKISGSGTPNEIANALVDLATQIRISTKKKLEGAEWEVPTLMTEIEPE